MTAPFALLEQGGTHKKGTIDIYRKEKCNTRATYYVVDHGVGAKCVSVSIEYKKKDDWFLRF